MTHLARDAWIEITICTEPSGLGADASRKRCVD